MDSPKLKDGPPVSNGPAVPTNPPPTTVAGATTVATAASTAAPTGPAIAPASDGCAPGEAPAATGITTIGTVRAGIESVAAYPSPGPGQTCITLRNPDPEFKQAPVFVVLRTAGEWTRVQLPSRPNGSAGWIRTADLTIAQHDYRIDISIGSRRVQVHKGDRTLLDTPAAVGTGDTPTPPGTYYTVALIKPTNAGYGPYAYALSGHSDALFSFQGGDGRIGLHGTDNPNSIGNAVSHGCIRIPNNIITQMAEQIRLPLGVPVVIST